MNKLAITIASGLGTGFIKFAPGTWGTALAAVLLGLVYINQFSHVDIIIAMMTLLTCGIGYWSILRLPKDWLQDDQRIVIDEVIGMFITILWIPLTWKTIMIGFVLFRLFDIFKPLGIRSFDRKKTHWAVIVDDIIAGVYANIVLRTILIFLF